VAQTPIATLNWNRTPNSDTFNAQAFLPFAVVSPGAGVANTAIQAGFLAPTLFKIRKVAVFYTAINTVSGIDAFNIVVGTGAYTQGVIAPNDNSFASNTQPTPTGTTMGNGVYSASNGVGYPTDVAGAGMAVFSADITFTTAAQAGVYAASTYAPGWISLTTTGGYGIFVPPNYDAVYPMLLPMTLRAVTTASTGSITGLSVLLDYVPVTPLANPGTGTTGTSYAQPGISY